jgi:CDP-glycerol glycerophosphotransferase
MATVRQRVNQVLRSAPGFGLAAYRRLPPNTQYLARRTGKRALRDVQDYLVRRSSLSVVMPVYNVEGYLAEAVDSVLSQSHRNFELILVDDGSTDTSGEMCDQFASNDSRIQVIHKANAGLGAARNTGIAAATGEFIAFIDSDDYLLPGAYEAMLRALRRSGADLVTANVRRRQGQRVFQAWNQSRSHVVDHHEVTLQELPELLFDTVAWNKIYRRSFFNTHVGGFPENKLYEDMVPVFKAMINAAAIEVLSKPVYVWRMRDERDSITQRLLERRNIDDRFEMLETISVMIRDRNLEDSLGEQLSDKILEGDLWIYVREMTGAEGEIIERIATVARANWPAASDRSKLIIPPERRVCYWLLCQGRGEEVMAFRQWYQSVNSAPPLRHADGRLLVLDTRSCPVSLDGIPELCLDMTMVARGVATVTALRWRSPTSLSVEGYAYTRFVSSGNQSISIVATEARTGAELELPVRRTDTTDAALWARDTVNSHEHDGFSCVIDIDQLRQHCDPRSGTCEWELGIRITDGDVVRQMKLDNIWLGGSAAVVGARLQSDGVVTRARTDPGQPLRITLSATGAAANAVHVDGATVRVRIDDPRVTAVWLVPTDDRRFAVARRDQDGWFTASVRPNPRESVQTTWRLRARVGGRNEPVLAPNGLGDELAPNSAGLQVIAEDSGRAAVRAYTRTAVIERVQYTSAGEIELSGVAYALNQVDIGVAPTAGEPTSWYAAQTERGRFQVQVPLTRVDFLGESRPLPHGRYQLRARRPGTNEQDDETRILVADVMAIDLPSTQLLDTIKVKISRAHRERLQLDISAPVPDALLGRFAQTSLESEHASLSRTLEDGVFFYVDLGASASDSALAIHEELRRRGTPLRLYWGVDDLSVAVPKGGIPVVKSSPQWYEKLNGCRYVVNNYGGVGGLVKHPDQRYLQTWHGTPYKFIGVSEAKHKNSFDSRYETIAREASEWDAFISPSPYMSELIPTEFLYSGSVLETGYPRNDRLVTAGARERDELRRAFGIPADARALLYAPTFREGQRHGWRAGLFDGLDLARLQAMLGPDWYILLRGHSFNARDTRASRSEGRLIDTTHHPDVNDLYLASDVLVTDYSSVMFDYAVTGKPIAYFTPDLKQYVAARGAYFDLAEFAPGPLFSDVVHLADALRDPEQLRAAHAERYEAFRMRFAPWDDGKAAARVVDVFFT